MFKMTLTSKDKTYRTIVVHLTVSVIMPYFLHTSDARSCTFPEFWKGRWYQKGAPSIINIESDNMTFKGSCLESNKYSLFLLEDRNLHCVRCLLMIQKHANILQYRQTYCLPKDSLENVCASMTSDQTLFTMFRIDGNAIECPFKGRYTFTYNRSRRQHCKSPVSNLIPCSQPSVFMFKFQACPDVESSESSEEKLTCLATWKESSTQYLMGRISHSIALSPDDQYRCFVYKDTPDSGILLSQSADASCNGFVQPGDGSRIMTLHEVKNKEVSCEFPTWLTKIKVWSTLDSRDKYIFNRSKSIFHIIRQDGRNSDVSVKATCKRQIEVTDKTYHALVHYVIGCTSHYYCLFLDKKNAHVADIITEESQVQPEYERCRYKIKNKRATTIVAEERREVMNEDEGNGGISSSNKLTTSLTASEKASSTWWKCREPFGGKSELSIEETSSGRHPRNEDHCSVYSSLRVACDRDENTIVLKSHCPSKVLPNQELRCIEAWNDTISTFIVAENTETNFKICIRYTASSNEITLRSQGSCSANSKDALNDEQIYNITSIGPCKLSHSSAIYQKSFHPLVIVLVLFQCYTVAILFPF